MPGFPAPFIKFREDDANGFPLAGGKLWSYAAGTSTPLATYSTQALTPGSENLNPTILDASGRAQIWIEDGVGYKFTLTDALGNVQWTVDDVQVPQIAAAPVPSAVPPGGIVAYGGTTAPSGWLLCDGASVSTGTYADLFAVIAHRFGGAGGTFNVPDLQQRFALGKAAAGTGATLGSTGGLIDHTHTGPSHTHTIAVHTHSIAAHTHTVPYNGWSTVARSPLPGILQAGGTGIGEETTVTQATGNNTTGVSSATDTGEKALTTDAGGTAATGTANPPYLVVNYIIKT